MGQALPYLAGDGAQDGAKTRRGLGETGRGDVHVALFRVLLGFGAGDVDVTTGLAFWNEEPSTTNEKLARWRTRYSPATCTT